MNNTQPNQLAPIQMKGALAAQSQKLAYAAPVLQVYGSVAQLTQGSGSLASDNLMPGSGEKHTSSM
ncbi:MAG: lasso RiPP family leader peptide-containing protein [Burkholderiales bacterium]|uniref:lasso RiPP family leader peptide-containing protein n=2 Tax=Candidatus Aalborgicola defluviihabitans TaxID=3386187 RepID=UPI001DFC9CD4|nr:lasso RiPP family leader peptide-containing protein [Burkholderiales bacterium]MBK6567498.1 lasso RiPP family leader peptide-containing protein [Burkholderiales bacterium]MBK7282458.1 lasso RiPP family leader peptide-containing protein [Burkholderiales bacterium]MBK7314201.1 lasso RiPP family leader peptide-containing protein [Burkholderiales bacterium]MBL0244851.1 lasso RiPP family leader peptide-containing protein [Rhodoferax sp.]